MRSFVNDHPVAAPIAFLGVVMVPARFILDGLDVAQLGLPGWAWSTIGAILFMGAIASIVYRQHQSLRAVAAGAGSASSELEIKIERRLFAATGENYKDRLVHVHDLVSDDDHVVKNCLFDTYTLVGPPIIFLADGTKIENPKFFPLYSLEDALIEIATNRRIAGVVAFQGTLFRNCNFKHIALTGDKDYLDRIRRLFKEG